MTEREIAEMLRAVLSQRHALRQRHAAFHGTLAAYVGVNLSDEDLDTMARAVVERVAGPLKQELRLMREGHPTFSDLRLEVEMLRERLADRDASLARVVEALTLLRNEVGWNIAGLTGREPKEAWIAMIDALLADAGAGKENL